MNDIIKNVKNKITLEKILMMAMHTPGVKINRETFLKKEFRGIYTEEIIEKAVKTNPAKAGIPKTVINEIADRVIKYETHKVTGISVAASIPGGIAAGASVTADTVSYFSFIIRTVQELAYLYGFEDFELNENNVDSGTMDLLLIFMGTMFGVQGASGALKKVADMMRVNMAKKLTNKALTKGTVYPIVKKVATKVGARMTKQIFADSVASVIPVIGGVLSGGLTYAMFKPGCVRLRNHLMSFDLCDSDY